MRAVLVLAICGLLGAGCSLHRGAGAADKAGGHGRPVTLRLALTDGPGNAPGRAAVYFADRVRELSGGRLRVRILWQAGGFQSPRWELHVAEMVRTRNAELALVPARAWSQSGAARLVALVAPFLITSDVVARRVVAGPLTAELLGGLRPAGAVGLGMVPAGLRHPFSFGRPLLMRSDFAGAAIRVPYSDIVYDGWRALGARPVDLPGSILAKAAAEGRVVAADSGYEFASGLTQTSTATGNLTPFARIDVLAAATGVFSGLGAHDRDVLHRAAADMTRNALATGSTDGRLARAFCAAGGRVVLAPADQVRTLVAATAPVTASLEHEPRTRRLIEQIRSWAATAKVEPVSSCGTAARAARPAPSRESAAIHALDGVYRLNWSEPEMVRAGISAGYASHTFGLETWTLKGGRYVYHTDDGLNPPDCRGPYTIRGHRLFVDFNVPGCVGTLDATWTLKGDQLWLSVRNNTRDDVIWWGTKPWRKIADAPA